MKGKYVAQHNKHGLNIVITSDGAPSSVIKVKIEEIEYLWLRADLSRLGQNKLRVKVSSFSPLTQFN